jgi:hypothetical protein
VSRRRAQAVSDNMSDGMAVKRVRVKVGATLDPDLVGAVDEYVAAHPGTDRSAVLDEALRLWCERQQEIGIERQHRAPRSGRLERELADWRRIRDAAARRTFRLPER